MSTAALDSDFLPHIVSHPDKFFVVDELKVAKFRMRSNGAPMCWTGGRAFVYCAELPSGASMAVRFPRETTDDQHTRYDAISNHFAINRATPLVPTHWHHDGVLMASVTHPIITMDWVSGQALDSYAASIATDRQAHAAFAHLAETWLESVRKLAGAKVAHGDIHAGNVMVQLSGATTHLFLVDYDSMWVPGLTVGSVESGRPAFQHPSGRAPWGPDMDAFPAALVYLSLRALAADPSLWDFNGSADDHLIFQPDDLADPRTSALFHRLAQSRDDHVRKLTEVVIPWMAGGAEAYRSLDDVVRAAISPVGSAAVPTTPNIWPPGGTTPPLATEPRQTWGASPTQPTQPPPPAPPPPAPSTAVPAPPRATMPPPAAVHQTWGSAGLPSATRPPPPRPARQRSGEVVVLVVIAIVLLVILIDAFG